MSDMQKSDFPNPTGNPVITDLNKVKRQQRLTKSKPRPTGQDQVNRELAAKPEMTAENKAALARRVAILSSGYKPQVNTIGEADKALASIVAQAAKAEAEVATTAVAGMAAGLASVAYLLLMGDEANKVAAIKADKTAIATVMRHVRLIPEMGQTVDTSVKLTGTKTGVPQIRGLTKFATVSMTTWRRAIMGGLLLADGRSKVQIGYVPGKVTSQFVPQLVFGTKKPAKGPYTMALCAPANVLRPREHFGAVWNAEAKAWLPETDGKLASEPNKDESLRAIITSNGGLDQLSALFRHWYDGTPLAFNDTVPNGDPNKPEIPSGLLYLPAARRAAVEERQPAPATEQKVADVALAAQAILNSIADKPLPQWPGKNPEHSVAALLELATRAFATACSRYQTAAPSGVLAGAIVDCAQAFAERVDVPDDDKPVMWRFKDGATKRVLETAGKHVLKMPKAEKPAASAA